MANTPNDIALTGSWTEMYTASGISSTTTIAITNKSSQMMYVVESSTNTAPTSSTKGYPLQVLETVILSSGSAYVFVIGTGPVLVQM